MLLYGMSWGLVLTGPESLTACMSEFTTHINQRCTIYECDNVSLKFLYISNKLQWRRHRKGGED